MTQAISDPKQASAALEELFDTHNHVVFFGGAGVSTASGIPDFRSVDGLYHQQFAYPPDHALAQLLRGTPCRVLRLLPDQDDCA